MTADFSTVLIDGPWRHSFVPANGTRFHVAEAGPEDGPLVVLLHSFPQFWWTWRHQLEALGAAGYRAVALDLRGTGASDKPPLGYDVLTRTRDVAGVVRSLGASSATIVGHGLGAHVAWSMPSLQPAVTESVVALACPHPARMHRRLRAVLTPRVARYLALVQLPSVPERQLRDGLAGRIVADGSVVARSSDELATYDSAMHVPFAAHNALEPLRWIVRSAPRIDGRRFLSVVRRPIAVPTMLVHGAQDPFLRADGIELDAAALCRDFRFEMIDGVGHFPHEEAPERVTALLLEHLGRL